MAPPPHRTHRRLGALALGALVLQTAAPWLSGCSVAAREAAAYSGPKNDCGSGCGDAAECIDGACRAAQTTYPFILEVTPPSAAHYAPNVTFTFDEVSSRSKGTRDLGLPLVSHVTVKSNPPIPLAVRLTRTSWVPGSAAGVFEARSSAKSPKDGDGSVTLDVSPEVYDLYVQPALAEDRAVYPPRYFPNQTLDSSRVLVVPYDSLDAFKTYDLTLLEDLVPIVTKGREVSIVDATSGLVVSTVVRTCATPDKARLRLGAPLSGHTHVVRIAPPNPPCIKGDALVLPAYDVDLAALSVDGGTTLKVLLPKEPETVSLYGEVVAAGVSPTQGVEASVVFRSSNLPSDVGRATYEVSTLSSGISGRFNVSLFPGKYTVEVVPNLSETVARRYAQYVEQDVVVADPAKGGKTPSLKSLPLLPRTRATGSATAPDGALFGLGTVEANPSTTLGSVTLVGKLPPRAGSGTVTLYKDKTYNLNLSLDPGLYDFTVRLPEASGFPWIVRPSVELLQMAESDLGTMVATAPVVIDGRVTDPNGDPVARATVRARALIVDRSEGKTPIAAVLVAETKADESGAYSLMLPASIDSTSKPK